MLRLAFSGLEGISKLGNEVAEGLPRLASLRGVEHSNRYTATVRDHELAVGSFISDIFATIKITRRCSAQGLRTVGSQVFFRDAENNLRTIAQRMARAGEDTAVQFVFVDEVRFDIQPGRLHVGDHFASVFERASRVVYAVNDDDLAGGLM